MKKILSVLLLCCMMAAYMPVYAETTTQQRLSAAASYVDELEQLIEQCEAIGLDVGYERADCQVIADFIGYGEQDLEWGHTERAEYVADCLDKLYEENKSKLLQYLAGSKTPFATIKNDVADYAGANGGDFVDKSGNPVIFNGYGVFDMLKNDIPRLQTFGADIAQIEIGPKSVLYEIGTINGWSTTVYGEGTATAELADKDGACLKIVNETPSTANGYLALSQTVSVKPNTTYTLSMRIKSVGAESGAFFSAQGWTGERCTMPSGSYDWTTYSVSHTTAEDEYIVEILFVSNKAARAIYIDDVVLCEQGTEENIIQNGDFSDSDGLLSEHFQANSAKIRDSVTRVLNNAYNNGVMVNVLISPHYFPEWIIEKYPETAEPDCGLGYDIYELKAQEALDLYIKALMQEIGDHPALHSICISNEPNCDTRETQGLDTEYSDFLSSIYESITALNKAYSTQYTSFDQVKMPSGDTMNAQYYDWVQFNNKYAADWNKFLAQTVKKYAPQVPVHAKIMTIFGKSDSLNFGIDPEDFAEFTDYNGNDAWGFYSETSSGLTSKLMWYELLDSIKPTAPIINSEDHIIEDGNENYSAGQAVHVGADIWQGAVHGRDASIVWIWNRTRDKTAATYGNILYRPDVLSQVSAKSLDTNRLAAQVAALQKSESKVSILYSPTTRAYSRTAVKVMKLAYEASLYAGANPGFITERQLAAGIKPQGVLIIPAVTNIPDSAYQAIKDFEQAGGKIIALGANCLAADEHNTPNTTTVSFDKTVTVSLSGNSITSPDTNTLSDIIADAAGLDLLMSTDATAVRNVEKITANYNGKLLWNLCNYSWSGTAYAVLPRTAQDLITGKVYNGYVELEPFTPVLLEFCEPEISINARVSGSGNSRTIKVDAVNTGKTGDSVQVSVFLRNSYGIAWERADFTRYVTAENTACFEYGFTLPEGNHSALVTAKYGNGDKSEPIILDIRKD